MVCSGKNLTDLKGIESFISHLDCGKNQITNLIGLEKMIGLEKLEIESNNITNIDIILNFKSLKFFDMYHNSVIDLYSDIFTSPVYSCTNIEDILELKRVLNIELRKEKIKDISI